jgi:hypothetical protein
MPQAQQSESSDSEISRQPIQEASADGNLQDESQPDSYQPEENQPEESQSEESQPEENLPEEILPEEILPEEIQPEETQPEESQPEERQDDWLSSELDPADEPPPEQIGDSFEELFDDPRNQLQSLTESLEPEFEAQDEDSSLSSQPQDLEQLEPESVSEPEELFGETAEEFTEEPQAEVSQNLESDLESDIESGLEAESESDETPLDEEGLDDIDDDTPAVFSQSPEGSEAQPWPGQESEELEDLDSEPIIDSAEEAQEIQEQPSSDELYQQPVVEVYPEVPVELTAEQALPQETPKQPQQVLYNPPKPAPKDRIAPEASTAVIVNYLEDDDNFFAAQGQGGELAEEDDMDIDLMDMHSQEPLRLEARPMVPAPKIPL